MSGQQVETQTITGESGGVVTLPLKDTPALPLTTGNW